MPGPVTSRKYRSRESNLVIVNIGPGSSSLTLLSRKMGAQQDRKREEEKGGGSLYHLGNLPSLSLTWLGQIERGGEDGFLDLQELL